MKLDGSTNRVVTGDGNVESFFSWESSNTFTIGAGGIQQMVMGGDGVRHSVTANGFIGSLQAYGDSATTIIIRAGASSVALGDGANRVSLAVAADSSAVLLNSFENVTASAFADDLTGDENVNVVAGGSGNDTLDGALGNDTIQGGIGNDILRGGDGNDLVEGGTGADIYQFGAGDDTDRVRGFQFGSDRIEFETAASFDDLVIVAATGGARVLWDGANVFVEGATVAQLDDAANFLF